ncbi:hypothetical protein, partial [Ralstonia sp. 3N]|uniref:hypothetical protein n=1 Tax=Ralstonia sp. 3N TaxID=2675750 RepID=UPI001C12F9DC
SLRALERLQYLAICESRLLHLQNSLLTRKFYFSQRWISGGITLGKVIIEPVTVKRHTGNRDNNGRQGGHRGQGKQAAAQRGGKESVLRHLNDR